MKMSVVIPVCNVREYLCDCIESLCASIEYAGCEHEVEIVLVDDGSTDGSAALLESLAHRCGARDRPCWWGLSGGVGVIDTAAANMFLEAPLMMP